MQVKDEFSFYILKVHAVKMGEALSLCCIGKRRIWVLAWDFVLLRIIVVIVIAYSTYFWSNLVKWLCSEVEIIDAGDKLK